MAATPTLLLLRHLVRSERPLNMLLLGTYRETELDGDHQLAQLLADLYRDTNTTRLRIGGLDERAIAALVDATVEHPESERAELVRALQAQTAGNPFFVGELLAHLAESGERSGAAIAATRLEAPEGLRHVIAQRVARLSAPAGRALQVAAAAGATFPFALLEGVLGEHSSALDALDEAVAAGLLTEAGHGDYAFAHALVRQTIYGQLGTARRMRLHRQLGEALEALGNIDAHAEALAHHFAQAAADGQACKAADYALAAGANAIARLGYEEAADHYDRGLQALALSGQPHEQQRCELLLALGDARWGAGELAKARHACTQAAELAEQLGDATALARAALGFCGFHRAESGAEVTRAVADLLQRALAGLGDDDCALRAQLMGRLAAASAYSAVEQRNGPGLAHQALQMARRVADKATLADVLASALSATRGPDSLRESLAIANELRRVADEVGDVDCGHWHMSGCSIFCWSWETSTRSVASSRRCSAFCKREESAISSGLWQRSTPVTPSSGGDLRTARCLRTTRSPTATRATTNSPPASSECTCSTYAACKDGWMNSYSRSSRSLRSSPRSPPGAAYWPTSTRSLIAQRTRADSSRRSRRRTSKTLPVTRIGFRAS
ncbi:MAG TPA: hypothetical protein VF526_10670 [Solirubrobacteraceae bacterium]